MKQSDTVKKLAMAGVLTAVAVVGSLLSFPIFGSKCAPVQHMVNILAAIVLGPGWGVGIAFCASLLRSLLGLGSLMAFPGSMIGALCCGLAYMAFRKLWLTCIAEASGTGILGGLAAYPVAKLMMGLNPGGLFVYIVPFLVSTVVRKYPCIFSCNCAAERRRDQYVQTSGEKRNENEPIKIRKYACKRDQVTKADCKCPFYYM
ncbi:MAG: energy coupling factor transporter S component ThiW [Eubacterium sp.]